MNKNKYISISCFIAWILLIFYTVIDSSGVLGFGDIGIAESLSKSNFTRIMFLDIGVLSTIIAGWIAFGTKEKLRFVFAILAMFIGSFAILPFLGIYFWRR